MSREIKFRGKRIDNNKWIYGYYVKSDEGEEGIKYVIQAAKGYEYVYGKTIGQFTGLKDRKEKEVYEGDIVEEKSTMRKARFVIEYIPEKLSYCYIENIKSKRFEWAFTPSKNIEVIGNIYENPELLKEE